MSSIAKELSAHTLANQVSLERQASSRSVVLVEGGSDARFLRQFVDREICSITVCHDRERVILTLEILKTRAVEGVLAVADKDYNDFLDEHRRIEDPDVIFTDENDLETSLIGEVLPKIINEYGTEERVQAFCNTRGMSTLDAIIEEAAKIGAVRYLHKVLNINVAFDGMDYQFSSAGSMEIDLSKTVRHLSERTNGQINEIELAVRVNDVLESVTRRISLCQGHDIVRIFGRALRRDFGSCADFDKNSRKKNDLYRLVRVSHERAAFLASCFAERIRGWEGRNAPWRVLAI